MKSGCTTNTAQRCGIMLFLFVSVFAVLSAPASASASIRIDDASAESGCATTTQIAINNMTNFGAATVTLSYDPTVVQINSVTEGDLGTPTANINNTAGTATIAAYVSTTTGPDSPITFANLELLAVGSNGNTSPLTLAITTLSDADGNSVDVTPISGAFVVGSGGAPASASIRIADASADLGCATTTQITINNMTNFGAATVTLSYDPTVVRINSTSAGDLGTPTANINNTAGTATIAAYVSTIPGPDSPLAFANLELLAVGSNGNTSPLTLAITTLSDADGNSVDATPMSGVFVIGTIKGDLNSDGILTPADAAIALEIAVGSRSCDAAMLAAADVSGDDKVTSLDALMILQATAGAISL